MELMSRPAVLKDFDEFYNVCFPTAKANGSLRAIMQREWDVLLRNPTTLSLILEDKDLPEGERIVGCGQAVFITEEFARLARCGLPPWMNAHVTRARPDGSYPYLLDLKGIRAANSGVGLNLLTTRLTITADRYSLADSNYIRRFLYDAGSLLTHGYKIKEAFIEATGEAAKAESLRAGYRVLNDYGAYYEQQGVEPSPSARPCLLHLTRTEALLHEGTIVSYLFAYTPPRIFFTPREQELLCLAATGVEDDEAAQRLHLTKWTVQARWQAIYRRVEAVLPNLLPAITPGAVKQGRRGVEKKRVLLRYLQTHPEELRPIERPSHAANSRRG